MTDAPFDWAQVHDFDPSEAGRTAEDVERLIAAADGVDDTPEPPPWIARR